MVEVSATDFRKDMFRLMRHAAQTGEDVVVRLRGKKFVVRPQVEMVTKAETESPEAISAQRWARYEEWLKTRPPLEAPEMDLDAVFDELHAEVAAELAAEWEEFYGPTPS